MGTLVWRTEGERRERPETCLMAISKVLMNQHHSESKSRESRCSARGNANGAVTLEGVIEFVDQSVANGVIGLGKADSASQHNRLVAGRRLANQERVTELHFSARCSAGRGKCDTGGYEPPCC